MQPAPGSEGSAVYHVSHIWILTLGECSLAVVAHDFVVEMLDNEIMDLSQCEELLFEGLNELFVFGFLLLEMNLSPTKLVFFALFKS